MAKQRRHLYGQRAAGFLRLVRGVPQERILCVSIDVHKYYHRVTIVNGYREIVVPSFQIDVFRSGFEELCSVIDHAVETTQAQVLFVGMEPTGHYFENLARHLRERYPLVRLVNSFAVKENRHQHMQRAMKDDDLDLASIGDLVLRNACFPYQPLQGHYLQLQEWVRYRGIRVKMRTSLINQITVHLDRVFPGLVRPQRAGRGDHPALFANLWLNDTAQHLIRVCPNPRELASMSPEQLVEMYHTRGWRMGVKTARRIIDFAGQVLLPDAETIAVRLPLLETDLQLLDSVNQVIAQAEEQIAERLAHTKGQILTQVKGIGTLLAASYVAGIGNPGDYEQAGQVFKRSGLVSGRNDSGLHQKGGAGHRVTKEGDTHLRSALIQLTRSLCLWQPYCGKYCLGLEQRGKHPGVAIVATARRTNGLLFALMRDQSTFSPEGRHEKATADIGPCEGIPAQTELIDCRQSLG